MDLTDWRGTPITPGDLVVYGVHCGNSVEMVEGEVERPAANGKIRVAVIRRSKTSSDRRWSDVQPSSLTVVSSLPLTWKENLKEKREHEAVIREKRRASLATHRRRGSWGQARASDACIECGSTLEEMQVIPCFLPMPMDSDANSTCVETTPEVP